MACNSEGTILGHVRKMAQLFKEVRCVSLYVFLDVGMDPGAPIHLPQGVGGQAESMKCGAEEF